jgi:hypothetical protein
MGARVAVAALLLVTACASSSTPPAPGSSEPPGDGLASLLAPPADVAPHLQTFVYSDTSQAILVQWVRDGDELQQGRLSTAVVVVGASAENVQRRDDPLTGTTDGTAVRLTVGGVKILGRFDGDDVVLTLYASGPDPGLPEVGAETLREYRLSPSTPEAYVVEVERLQKDAAEFGNHP